MKTYINPEVDMITFLVEDILTLSIGSEDGTPLRAVYKEEFRFS